MIHREATIKYKGYDPNELSYGSSKRICCICDHCGRVRWCRMDSYKDLCKKCCQLRIISNKDYITEKVIVSKLLYHLTTDNVRLQITCQINKNTEYPGIYTGFCDATTTGKMKTNRECPVFLGVYVAENILSKIYKNVIRMPYANPEYDFICGKGYKIDVKSSCIHKNNFNYNSWSFTINKNIIADYFLCLGFDNRNDLNPIHIWLIPGYIINYKNNQRISESKLSKWEKYEQPIDKIISCCNTMKES